MIFNGCCKHVTYLGCHKCNRKLIVFHILVHRHQVHSHLTFDDMNTTTNRNDRINIHHVGIETKISICYGLVCSSYIKFSDIPMAEIDNIMMLKHNTLRHTCWSWGIKDNKHIVWCCLWKISYFCWTNRLQLIKDITKHHCTFIIRNGILHSISLGKN